MSNDPTRAMDASIIVCSYNRAHSLAQTLDALRALKTAPSRSWEVIVVDNNSSDHTRRVVEKTAEGWRRLRYTFEPKQGLSHARNRGIVAAAGEVLLFTDDDVLPEPDWLERTLEGLKRFQADACGGYIGPIWEVPPPPWLTERFYGFLALRTDRTDSYLMSSRDQTPFGANMAFRRGVFEQVGNFDTERGRKGKILASGEDGEMFARLHEKQLRVAFLGQARVHHKIEAFRCTRRYLRRWRHETSRNLALTLGVPGRRRILNVPLYLIPQTARAAVRAAAANVAGPPDDAVHRQMILSHFVGTIQGLYEARSSSRSGRTVKR